MKWGVIRLTVGLLLALGMFVLAVEAGSAYVIYRHYSTLHRAYYPAGLATLALAKFVAHGGGRHDEVELAIDHGPLFHSDPKLGYVMFPGVYRIVEKRGGQSHRFTLTVDESQHRITSAHPIDATRRLFIAGDSAMFGWGLNDEQTAPWLLQSRFPTWKVLNYSLTSYSTIHALRELEVAQPPVGPDDIVVLTYHPITNGFNIASADMLGYLGNGFEHQLGDADLAKNMAVPTGSLVGGKLAIGSYRIDCGKKSSPVRLECERSPISSADAMEITKAAFDAIMTAHPAHYVVAFFSGPTADPVIAHLRAKGAVIADVRTSPADPDANDEVSIDEHAGPFWHRNVYERLADVLVQAKLAD